MPIEDIYRGGNSKPRNPRIQTMLRMIGFGDNAGSGFPAILAAWKNECWIRPELTENTVLNQVTLTLKTVTKMNEVPNINKKNERSLSEVLSGVLSKKDFDKVQDIIKYIEENGEVTPEVATEISGKSAATTRRYMRLLVNTGYIESQGNTNNLIYKSI